MDHLYRKNLLKWAHSLHINVQSGSYPRPSASGASHWWRFDPGNAKAQITFVHGTGDDALFPFAALLRRLVPCGIVANLFDLDGHGAQSSTLFDERTIASCVGDGWHQNPINLPHHVIGFSLGAALALQAVRSGDITPDSLILLAPPLQVDGEWTDLIPEIRSLSSSLFWNTEDGNSPLARLPALGPFGRKRFPIRLSQDISKRHYLERVKRAINRLNLNQTRNLTTPTLVIYGENDRICKPMPRDIWRQIAVRSKTQILPDTSHFVLPLNPECGERILTWLTQECQVF